MVDAVGTFVPQLSLKLASDPQWLHYYARDIGLYCATFDTNKTVIYDRDNRKLINILYWRGLR